MAVEVEAIRRRHGWMTLNRMRKVLVHFKMMCGFGTWQKDWAEGGGQPANQGCSPSHSPWVQSGEEGSLRLEGLVKQVDFKPGMKEW